MKRKIIGKKQKRKSVICYVCGRKIRPSKKAWSINKVYIGQGLYRHLRCRPFSEKWLAWAKDKPECKEFYDIYMRCQKGMTCIDVGQEEDLI